MNLFFFYIVCQKSNAADVEKAYVCREESSL